MTNKFRLYALLFSSIAVIGLSHTSRAETAPTVSIAADPMFVAAGEQSRITWSSSNATQCVGTGSWTGVQPLSDSKNTRQLQQNETFVLTCTGPGGSASNHVTVSVTGASKAATSTAPTLTMHVSPATVTSGSRSQLTWSTTKATACTGSGSWGGARALSGDEPTSVLKANVTYTLKCTGPGGSTSEQVSVAVTTPAPTLTMRVSPTTVTSGNRSTLVWSTTNATACTGSGSWGGARGLSGDEPTSVLKADVTYALKCTGPGGSVSNQAKVAVTPPAPTVTMHTSPTTVTSGSRSTLIWSTTNATACTGTGSWGGTRGLSGDVPTSILKADVTYALRCTGPGGASSDSASVTVKAVPVTGDATLSWAAPTKNTNGTAVKLAGYHLYYGNSAEALTKSVSVSGASTTSYEITGLAAGTWYFAVAADSANGTESAKSAVGSKTI